MFFTNVATTFHFSYQRYLENRLREEFGFEGTPIRIHVRARRRKGREVRTVRAPSRRGSERRRSGTIGGEPEPPERRTP